MMYSKRLIGDSNALINHGFHVDRSDHVLASSREPDRYVVAGDRPSISTYPTHFRGSTNPFEPPYQFYNAAPAGRPSTFPYRDRTAASQYEYRRYTNPDPYDDEIYPHPPVANYTSTNPFVDHYPPSFYADRITGSIPTKATTISQTKTTSHLLYEQYTNNYNRNLAHHHHHQQQQQQQLQQQQLHYQHDPRHYFRDHAPPATNYYGPFTTKPIKMEREQVIIEHSQLVAIAGNNNNESDNRTGGGMAAGGPRPHHYTQIIAALAVSLGPLAAGLGKGYSSPAIASLQELSMRQRGGNHTTFTVSDQQASWVASLSLLGALFGGMFGGLAMQYGRRRLLTLMSLPFSLSWILTVFAKSVEMMFATAFLGGFCCAIVTMVTQVYISEIASPDIRGFLSAIQKIAGHLGIMISFSLGAYLDWRQLAMLVSVAPMMLFLTVIYIPETPSFLVLKGRDEEAYRSLQWLRGPNKNVELELETIKANIRVSRLSSNSNSVRMAPITTRQLMSKATMTEVYKNVKSVLHNARLLRPILITCGLMVFQRFTGANSFNFYAVRIFRQTFSGMNPHGGAISVGFVQLLASMLSGLLIDTVGRIPLLITSSVFMSLALASFGSYVYYYEEATRVATAAFDIDAAAAVNNDWIPLLCVLVFTIAFSLGISPISSLLVSELFPLEYRGVGSSIATSFSYFCAFLSVKTFVDFEAGLGLHGAFWLYAFISSIGLIFVVLFVPETKGKDLDEMDPKFVRTTTLTINR